MFIFAIQFNFNANFSFDEGQSKIATWGNLFSQKMKSFCQQMKSPPDFSRRSQMDLRQCSASQTDRGTRKCQMARDNIVRGEKLHCARTEIGRGLAKKCPWRRLAAGRHLSRGCMDQLLILSLYDFFVAILSIRVRNRFRFILICEMRLIALDCVSLRRQFDNYSGRWLSRQFVKLPWFRVFAVLDVSCLVDVLLFWQIQIHNYTTKAQMRNDFDVLEACCLVCVPDLRQSRLVQISKEFDKIAELRTCRQIYLLELSCPLRLSNHILLLLDLLKMGGGENLLSCCNMMNYTQTFNYGEILCFELLRLSFASMLS